MAIRSYKDKTPDIHATAYVDETAVVIGDVSIGQDSSVWPMSVIRGDVNSITIGARTNIQDGSVLHESHTSEFSPGYPLVIGDDVTVGHKALLHACTVGNMCLIGMSATVMDGAVLGDNVIIGAGSLVPPGKQLESGYLYVGSPVKKIRELNEKERAFLKYSAKHYSVLKDNYKNSC
ncbi:MAG: carbonic anhydrase/acetyltransferase-like protein (isoleucine patch superfamily) [Gammaproteobacteria bacterium]|jgi:carbonic anhydrase/acetyltransferase-like protein (isoleucine patch superfamily)